MNVPDTLLSICAVVALVIRLAFSLRPAKRLNESAGHAAPQQLY